MSERILAINPGSTSTKIGIFEGTKEVRTINLSHSAEEIARFPQINDQLSYRLEAIQAVLKEEGLKAADFAAIVGRGGLLKPVVSGTYAVNEAMLTDLKSGEYGIHASNLGGVLANLLAKEACCPAFIVDPVVVDELTPVARLTGLPEMPRQCIFHALNQKAVAKRFAAEKGKAYEELNLIVAHLGGGISVGCHAKGQVVEVNNALNGDGPFSPERAGTVQAMQFAKMVKERSLDDIKKLLAGKGGLVAHLGTNDAREVERRIHEGDKQAELVYDALIYQIARYIAANSVAVNGKIDYILLTGGIAYSKYLTARLIEKVQFVAPVEVLPGEDELQALAEGAYRVLTGKEQAKTY